MEINRQIPVIYDIACKLEPHMLHNQESGIDPTKIQYILPQWHAKAHTQKKCTVLMNAKNIDNLGMVDGEGMIPIENTKHLNEICK